MLYQILATIVHFNFDDNYSNISTSRPSDNDDDTNNLRLGMLPLFILIQLSFSNYILIFKNK